MCPPAAFLDPAAAAAAVARAAPKKPRTQYNFFSDEVQLTPSQGQAGTAIRRHLHALRCARATAHPPLPPPARRRRSLPACAGAGVCQSEASLRRPTGGWNWAKCTSTQFGLGDPGGGPAGHRSWRYRCRSWPLPPACCVSSTVASTALLALPRDASSHWVSALPPLPLPLPPYCRASARLWATCGLRSPVKTR